MALSLVRDVNCFTLMFTLIRQGHDQPHFIDGEAEAQPFIKPVQGQRTVLTPIRLKEPQRGKASEQSTEPLKLDRPRFESCLGTPGSLKVLGMFLDLRDLGFLM